MGSGRIIKHLHPRTHSPRSPFCAWGPLTKKNRRGWPVANSKTSRKNLHNLPGTETRIKTAGHGGPLLKERRRRPEGKARSAAPRSRQRRGDPTNHPAPHPPSKGPQLGTMANACRFSRSPGRTKGERAGLMVSVGTGGHQRGAEKAATRTTAAWFATKAGEGKGGFQMGPKPSPTFGKRNSKSTSSKSRGGGGGGGQRQAFQRPGHRGKQKINGRGEGRKTRARSAKPRAEKSKVLGQ